MASIFSGVYNTLFKRNTVFLGTVFISAFALEMGFETASERIWDGINRGRQWKDIKQKYMGNDNDEEDDD